MSEEALRGVIKFFNHNKGYGFITIPDQEEGIFVHVTDVLEGNEYLEEGEEVEFEIGEGPKGPQAVKVKRVEEEEE